MIPVFDMHADVFMDLVRRAEAAGDGGTSPELVPRHIDRMRSGGIRGAALIDCRMAGEEAEPRHLESFIRVVRREAAAAGPGVRIVRSGEELKAAWSSGAFSVVVGYEGLAPARGDLGWISRLYSEADLRIASLTHNGDNELGGGALGERDGLTEKGREALSILNELGVLVDLAHAGGSTRRDILAASSRPVLLSHTSAKAVYDNGRNLSDGELRAVADRGGLVGCMTSPAALAPADDRKHRNLGRYMEHLRHMIDVAGIEHVGLGLHFCEYLYSADVYPPPDGLEDASRTGGIVESLLDSGLREGEAEKVAFGNFARVFSEAVG